VSARRALAALLVRDGAGVRITLDALRDRQRRDGWPDIHPEDYCHRCGGPNVSWFVDSPVWNAVMRPDGPDSPWRWQEIICPPCFIELAGGGTWELKPSHGTRWAA
jgi:hypothetical protein